MLAKSFIKQDQPVLRPKQLIADGIALCASHGTERLPIVDAHSGKLIGMADRLLLEALSATKAKKLPDEWAYPVVLRLTTHLFDALRLFMKHAQASLPVVDAEGLYLGMVHRVDIEHALFQELAIDQDTGILSIEIPNRDFTLTTLIRLIESEAGKLLGLTVHQPDTEDAPFVVNMKLHSLEMARITAALRRHGFTVLYASGDELLELEMSARADEFLHYLSI